MYTQIRPLTNAVPMRAPYANYTPENFAKKLTLTMKALKINDLPGHLTLSIFFCCQEDNTFDDEIASLQEPVSLLEKRIHLQKRLKKFLE